MPEKAHRFWVLGETQQGPSQRSQTQLKEQTGPIAVLLQQWSREVETSLFEPRRAPSLQVLHHECSLRVNGAGKEGRDGIADGDRGDAAVVEVEATRPRLRALWFGGGVVDGIICILALLADVPVAGFGVVAVRILTRRAGSRCCWKTNSHDFTVITQMMGAYK